MSERKYKYKKPQTQDEYIEAIHEELSLSPSQNGRNDSTDTLKDYVAALLTQMRRAESQRKIDSKTRSSETTWAQGALAGLAMLCLFLNILGGTDNGQWLDQHIFAIRLWGVAFAAVFIGVSIERTSFFSNLWSFGVTKVVASFAASGLIVFSTGKAAGLVNGVFPVDASALPYTRAIVTGVLAFKYSYPLLGIIGLFALFHALNAASWLKKNLAGKGEHEDAPLMSIAFLVLSLTVFTYFTRWVNSDFSTEAWPAKIYRLAHLLDFNSKYECTNLRKGLSVVFLGPDHARVLVDASSAQTDDLESFVDAGLSGQVSVPQRFYVLPCDLGIPK